MLAEWPNSHWYLNGQIFTVMPRTNSSVQAAMQSSVLAMEVAIKVVDTVSETLYDLLNKKEKSKDFL